MILGSEEKPSMIKPNEHSLNKKREQDKNKLPQNLSRHLRKNVVV